jgi:uncharacterized protein
MKLQPDLIQSQAVTGYGDGWISINGEKYTHSMILSSSGERRQWSCSDPMRLQASDFEFLASLDLEMIIYGSGDRLCFPDNQTLLPLIAKGIGIETMDTRAACRTYNILAGEGRKVAAALLLAA